jgi:hypothetical protein
MVLTEVEHLFPLLPPSAAGRYEGFVDRTFGELR